MKFKKSVKFNFDHSGSPKRTFKNNFGDIKKDLFMHSGGYMSSNFERAKSSLLSNRDRYTSPELSSKQAFQKKLDSIMKDTLTHKTELGHYNTGIKRYTKL
jgi:hypothetical protein